MIMPYNYICAALVIVIIIQSILHYVERKDLYTRLMSRNLREYEKFNKVGSDDAAIFTKESAHRKALKKWDGGGDE